MVEVITCAPTEGWPNKQPTFKGAIVSAKIILPTIYMATMTPSISLVPTYQL